MDQDRQYAELLRKKFEGGETWNNQEIPLKIRESLREQYIELTIEKVKHYRRDTAMQGILLK